MDPITIGTLVAAALVGGATEAGKGVLGGAAKDAYDALKSRLAGWFSDDTAALEADPTSKGRAVVLAELVDNQPEPVQTELQQLAETLRGALTAEGRATIDNRVTVIATRGGIAAGRDVNLNAATKPGGEG